LVAILARSWFEFILRGCLRTQSALGKILDVVLTAPRRIEEVKLFVRWIDKEFSSLLS
jgi:hypothetical protein